MLNVGSFNKVSNTSLSYDATLSDLTSNDCHAFRMKYRKLKHTGFFLRPQSVVARNYLLNIDEVVAFGILNF